MAITKLLATGITPTSYPDPNTLGVVIPVALNDFLRKSPPYTATSAWTAQAVFCFSPTGLRGGEGEYDIDFEVEPLNVSDAYESAGQVTNQILLFNPLNGKWATPKDNATIATTGRQTFRVTTNRDSLIYIRPSVVTAPVTKATYRYDPVSVVKI